MPRTAVVAAVAVAVIAAVALIAWRPWAGDGFDKTAFFAVPEKTSCAGGIDVTVSTARFAAHAGGQVPPESGHKFLLLDAAAVKDGQPGQPPDPAAFTLSDQPGRTYRPYPMPSAASSTVVLRFSVPLDTGAAKLIYDDGCTHQEWVVP